MNIIGKKRLIALGGALFLIGLFALLLLTAAGHAIAETDLSTVGSPTASMVNGTPDVKDYLPVLSDVPPNKTPPPIP